MADALRDNFARAVRNGLLRKLTPLELRALAFFLSEGATSEATVEDVGRAIGSSSGYRVRRAIRGLESRGLLETVQARGGRVATRRRVVLADADAPGAGEAKS